MRAHTHTRNVLARVKRCGGEAWRKDKNWYQCWFRSFKRTQGRAVTWKHTLSLRWRVLSVAWMMTAQGEGDASVAVSLPLLMSLVCVSFSSTRLMLTITFVFSKLTAAQQNATHAHTATWAGFLLLHKIGFVCVLALDSLYSSSVWISNWAFLQYANQFLGEESLQNTKAPFLDILPHWWKIMNFFRSRISS